MNDPIQPELPIEFSNEFSIEKALKQLDMMDKKKDVKRFVKIEGEMNRSGKVQKVEKNKSEQK